eukprot:Nitzschia sp. Nitz4//scaffold85_size83877//39018//40535//NITZ4_005228-RA/size83877-processed-gene-0.24-mRNA-1//1//CDS//3329559134//274//frame0
MKRALPNAFRILSEKPMMAPCHIRKILSMPSSTGQLRSFSGFRARFSTNQVDIISALQQSEDGVQSSEQRLALSGMQAGNDETFKVAEVHYRSGVISTINLPPGDILKRTSILPRDLVSLHLTSKDNQKVNGFNRRYKPARPPTAIMPRTDCILLSFGNIRAVAGRDAAYVFDAHSRVPASFSHDLSHLFRTDLTNDPPELIFLEAVLRDTVDSYTRRVRIFEPIVDNFLDKVSNEVFSDSGVNQLVPLKDSLQSFEMQIKQSLECLTDILNDDDLMLDLLLTEQAEARKSGVAVDFDRHEDVELMLSVYSRQIQSLQQDIQYLLSRIQSKQEFVALALAAYRNRLIRINVNIGIMGVSLGIMTATTGLFGMNLVSGLEDSAVAFAVVTACSATLASSVATIYFSFIRGSYMQARAEQSQAEIETFIGAISDMSALDYTIKKMIRDGSSFDKKTFRKELIKARESHYISEAEVDFLFTILDSTKDNNLNADDFVPHHDPHISKHY